ncbi:MAG: ABC transporter substrate-binding protein [Actinomycetota bacterium]
MGEPSKAGRLLILIAALPALLGAGCTDPGAGASKASPASGSAFPVEVAAANGTVTIDRQPERIVSLSPTATEILFAIGAGPQVVAVDNASTYPPGAPVTGLSGYTPNIEALTAQRPDLVVFSFDPGGLESSLAAIGVPGLLQPPAVQLEDTYQQILDLGTATGRNPEAAGLVAGMRSELDEIVRSLPAFSRPPLFYHELDEGYYTATSSTYIGEIYGMLGLENLADPADTGPTGFVQLSAEFIVSANPDLIFLADARCCGQSAETVAGRPGWGGIDAVRNGAVIPLDDDIASRWGPRTVDFARTVAGVLKDFEKELP